MSKKSKKQIKDVRPRLSGAKLSNFNFFNNDESRVLVVGDLHSPFDLDSYFDHCVEVYERYNCNRVVFIGDVIDNHYSSYHETDADGMGGGQELELAIKRLERYYHRWPDAHVTVGNHDRIIMRKAQSGGVPKEWIKDYQEVLRTPGWKYVTDVEIDGVLYIHGEAGTAKTKARADMRSTVQGHLHTQAYTEYFVGANSRVFGTQVGCGIDAKSYAMAYMKVGKKPAIGCAVVLGGKTAINELMVL
tara:strand:+ start:2752 stop:3489 length:738 start_codon:yes stop_codon:yes gene_type:complete